MICQRCGKNEATVAVTDLSSGEKTVLYLCRSCHGGTEEEPPEPKLERPCERCRKREATVRYTQLRESRRVVYRLCEVCAAKLR